MFVYGILFSFEKMNFFSLEKNKELVMLYKKAAYTALYIIIMCERMPLKFKFYVFASRFDSIVRLRLRILPGTIFLLQK